MKIVKPLYAIGAEVLLPKFDTNIKKDTRESSAKSSFVRPEGNSKMSVYTSIFDLARPNKYPAFFVIREVNGVRYYLKSQVLVLSLDDDTNFGFIRGGLPLIPEEGFLLVDKVFYRVTKQNLWDNRIPKSQVVNIDFKQLKKDLKNAERNSNHRIDRTFVSTSPSRAEGDATVTEPAEREILEAADLAFQHQIEALQYLADS